MTTRLDTARRASPSRRRMGISALIVAVLATAMAAFVSPLAASAESGSWPGASNPFFVYLKAGESVYVSVWPSVYSVVDQAGTTVTDPDSDYIYGPATADGVWQVSVGNVNSGGGAVWWNVGARAADGTPIPGRVWSDNFRLSQVGDYDMTTDFTYWFVGQDGYEYKYTAWDYNGIYSRLRADSIGNETSPGNCTPSYLSIGNEVAAWNPVPSCGLTRHIFFEEPASDLPASAISASGTVFVKPEPIADGDLAAANLTFAPTSAGASDGTFAWTIDPRFQGSYHLEIDADGDGQYGGPLDRTVLQYANGSGDYSYQFDGLDGAGNPVSEATCTAIHARVHFDKVGEIHVDQDDVEQRVGVEMIRLNGPGAPDPTMYWNDTQLTTPRTTTTPVTDGTAGVDSTGGVHGWAYGPRDSLDPAPWGNNRAIDDWAFRPVDINSNEVTLAAQCLSIEKSSDATADAKEGDVVTYTVTATNTGGSDFTDAIPAIVTDDLTGVLDDADYNDDVTASVGATPTYSAPRISWSGPLAAGASVTLTYTVTLKAGGDGIVRNVAFGRGGDTPDPSDTPECDPRDANGQDPDTGLPCGLVTFPLRHLTITKTADTDGPLTIGKTVKYTVVVTNVGPGAYTDESPATMTDDLSDVIDDGLFEPTSVSSTTGTTAYVAPNLTWTGALAAKESVTITYTVKFTGDGDLDLDNTACVPERDVVVGEDACDSVRLTGSKAPAVLGPVARTGGSTAAGIDPAWSIGVGFVALVGAIVLARRLRRNEQ